MDCGLCSWSLAVVAVLVLIYVGCYFFGEHAPYWSVKNRHILISGGSSGIGLATAIQLVSVGSRVTIVARNQQKLDEAVAAINEKTGRPDQILAISLDVSNQAKVATAFKSAEKKFGAIDGLVLSAGISRPGHIENLSLSDFEDSMNINFFGVVNCIKAVVPDMIARRDGRIMIISSMAGLSGISGYTAYSSSKFALRGLAESLQMELLPKNVYVSLCNPPDVDTPMLAAEAAHMPADTKAICEGSGLFTADAIATGIVQALQKWAFLVNYGFDGIMLRLLAVGTAPADSPLWNILELFFIGIIRVVSIAYRWHYNTICHRVYQQQLKSANKKAN